MNGCRPAPNCLGAGRGPSDGCAAVGVTVVITAALGLLFAKSLMAKGRDRLLGRSGLSGGTGSLEAAPG